MAEEETYDSDASSSSEEGAELILSRPQVATINPNRRHTMAVPTAPMPATASTPAEGHARHASVAGEVEMVRVGVAQSAAAVGAALSVPGSGGASPRSRRASGRFIVKQTDADAGGHKVIEMQFEQSEDFFRAQAVLAHMQAPSTWLQDNVEYVYPTPEAPAVRGPAPVPAVLDAAMAGHAGEEPRNGMPPPSADVAHRDEMRKAAQFVNYVPFVFRYGPLPNANQIPAAHKVVGWQALLHPPAPAQVVFVHVSDLSLPKKWRKQMWKLINRFPNVQVVTLRNLRLRRVDKFDLPKLRYLDLKANDLRSPKQVKKLVQRSPHLEVADFGNNPVTTKQNWHVDVVASAHSLRFLNGRALNLQDHLSAIKLARNKVATAFVPMLKWDWFVSSSAPIKALPAWDASKLTSLSITQCDLTAFHVGSMTALITLDLSYNRIKLLHGGGLERLSRLETLGLQNNDISDARELAVFALMPALKSVYLANNRVKAYRSHTINYTSNLAGFNRMSGIAEIDGTRVSIDERIEALQKHGGMSNTLLAERRWQLVLLAQFGAHQLRRVPRFADHVRRLCAPSARLKYANLQAFEHVEYVDLSGNELATVDGLQRLHGLRVLLLHDNAPLKLKSVLESLREATALEEVSMRSGSTVGATTSSASERKYRVSVVGALAFDNRGLRLLDGKPIHINERVDAYKVRTKDAQAAERYRFHLAALTSATPAESNREMHPTAVGIGAQYDVNQVTELAHLGGLGLVDAAVNFAPFRSLTKLNLSHNAIRDITALGLEECVNLMILDASHNKINTSVAKIGKLVDGLARLQVLCLRANPCMSKPSDRIKLINSIQQMREISVVLTVIDTYVTIDERVHAWEKQGGKPTETQVLRYKAALAMRVPPEMPMERVRSLDLRSMKLQLLDLRAFRNLEVLLLRDNLLSSLDLVSGLHELQSLRVLDMRDNALSSLDEVLALVNALTHLSAVGFAGNKFSKASSKYRPKFLKGVRRLHSISCQLRFLDEEEILLQDVIDEMKKAKTSSDDCERFRFAATLFRRSPPDVQPEALQELNLEGCHLVKLDLSSFRSLRKLSLRNNKLKSSAVQAAGLWKLNWLQGLDLSGNQIEKLDTFVVLLDGLMHLHMLNVHDNVAFTTDTASHRLRLLGACKHVQKPEWRLEYLNNVEVTLDEKVAALAENGGMNATGVEAYRTHMVLHKMQVTKACKELCLQGKSLSVVSPVAGFQNITLLDLSHNALEDIASQRLDQLPRLHTLYLNNNRFAHLKDVYEGLRLCNALRVLHVKECTTNKDSAEPEEYGEEVFKYLRGLEVLDNYANPFPLSDYQMAAVRYLLKIAGVGANSVINVDITHVSLPESEFPKVLNALGRLPVRHLRAASPSWERVRLYRLKLLHFVGTLEVLDDTPVSLDERNHAYKLWGPPHTDHTARDAAAGAALGNGKVRAGGGVQRRLEHVAELGVEAGMHNNEAEEAVGMGAVLQIDEVQSGMNAGGAQLSYAAEDAAYGAATMGTYLSKMDIIVHFFQIYGLVLSFSVPWPEEWRYIMEWTLIPFSFDIDFFWTIDVPFSSYLKFFMFMMVPAFVFVFYQWTWREARWQELYVMHWPRTKVRAWMALFAGVAFWVLLGFCVDPVSFSDGATENTNAFIACTVSFYCAFWVVWLFVVKLFRRHYDSPTFWFKFIKWKKRISLFFLSVLYMPTARVILWNFKGVTDEDGTCHLLTFDNHPCLESASDLRAIHAFSIFFALLYIIGIPVFFGYLIFRGTQEVMRTNQLDIAMRDLEEYRALIREELDKPGVTKEQRARLKAKLKRREEEFGEHYERAVRSYDKPQAYLYNAYERKFKYYKVVTMAEKLALLMITLYVPASSLGEFKVLMAAVVIGLFSGLATITRPFMDVSEDVMDVVARSTNTVNVLFGFLLDLGSVGSVLGNVVLIGVNIFNIGVMVAIVVGVTSLRKVMAWWRRRKGYAQRRTAAPIRKQSSLTLRLARSKKRAPIHSVNYSAGGAV